MSSSRVESRRERGLNMRKVSRTMVRVTELAPVHSVLDSYWLRCATSGGHVSAPSVAVTHCQHLELVGESACSSELKSGSLESMQCIGGGGGGRGGLGGSGGGGLGGG